MIVSSGIKEERNLFRKGDTFGMTSILDATILLAIDLVSCHIKIPASEITDTIGQ